MGDVPSPLHPSTPELEKSGLTMLFYGIFIAGIAAIIFTTYNFILIRWCTNNDHPLPTRRPAIRRGGIPQPPEAITAAPSMETEGILISIDRKKIGLITSSFKYRKSTAENHQLEVDRIAAEQEQGGSSSSSCGAVSKIVDLRDDNDNGDDDDECCAVCLSVFEQGEELRQLPNCNHSFHAPCIDMWLYSHLDCPLCRTPLDFTSLLATHHQETRIQVA